LQENAAGSTTREFLRHKNFLIAFCNESSYFFFVWEGEGGVMGLMHKIIKRKNGK
jgi:hypothetical protein